MPEAFTPPQDLVASWVIHMLKFPHGKRVANHDFTASYRSLIVLGRSRGEKTLGDALVTSVAVCEALVQDHGWKHLDGTDPKLPNVWGLLTPEQYSQWVGSTRIQPSIE